MPGNSLEGAAIIHLRIFVDRLISIQLRSAEVVLQPPGTALQTEPSLEQNYEVDCEFGCEYCDVEGDTMRIHAEWNILTMSRYVNWCDIGGRY